MRVILLSVMLASLPMGMACAQNGWGTGGNKPHVAPVIKLVVIHSPSPTGATTTPRQSLATTPK